MNKLLSTTILISFCFSGYSQIIWDEEKQSAKSETILDIEGVSQKDLYERTKIWMARNLKSSDNQTLLDDEGHERIIGTGNLLLANRGLITDRILNFKLSVYFKEGRCKIVGDNMVFSETWNSLDGSNRTAMNHDLNQVFQKMTSQKKQKRKKFMDDIDEAFAQPLKSLESDLRSGSSNESDDW